MASTIVLVMMLLIVLVLAYWYYLDKTREKQAAKRGLKYDLPVDKVVLHPLDNEMKSDEMPRTDDTQGSMNEIKEAQRIPILAYWYYLDKTREKPAAKRGLKYDLPVDKVVLHPLDNEMKADEMPRTDDTQGSVNEIKEAQRIPSKKRSGGNKVSDTALPQKFRTVYA
ncbi:unnamed protein product [Strongylus vulgaris]|uniref:Uncharacterized protein n=1 Tax=Strongylus vulgaris TaxID=40348 RepID=A0A3P7KX90_STRVU|nr:unnamed protein product [Strongylus vulgaris]